MTEQNNNLDTLRPRKSISLEKEEVSGISNQPKISSTNWRPSSRQEELRKRLEQQEEERKERARQEFECRVEIQLIRALEKKVASLEKQIKKITTETK